MIGKLIEIRDKGTFIPALAISGHVVTVLEHDYLLRRGGWAAGDYPVYLTRLQGGQCEYDPHSWSDGSRTFTVAHYALLGRVHPEIDQERAAACQFERIKDGDVIDVEYLLGETREPKVSERVTAPC